MWLQSSAFPHSSLETVPGQEEMHPLVQPFPGGLATGLAPCRGGVSGSASAPCSHLHLHPAWGAGAHGTGLRAGEAGADAEQEAWRWICIPWEVLQTPAEERGAASPEPEALHPSQAAGPAPVCSL